MGSPNTGERRLRRLGREVFEALTFGAGMFGSLVCFVYVVQHTTGYAGIVVCTVVLMTIGVLAAWRWQRYGPVAGMMLALVPCWLLVSIVGAPGTLD